MDARIVAFFVLLCLSTSYSLKNDGENDDILDQLLKETDTLKGAPEMASLCRFCSICHTGIEFRLRESSPIPI